GDVGREKHGSNLSYFRAEEPILYLLYWRRRERETWKPACAYTRAGNLSYFRAEVRSEYMELRKAGARRCEAGSRDFSAEKYP
ncbi:MAG: hypothetical protein AAB471_02315, partial [Patescibacteria group bacterium]